MTTLDYFWNATYDRAIQAQKDVDKALTEAAAEQNLVAHRARAFGPLEKGAKHDDGKLPLHLLPVDALEAITEILDFGARKYAPRNWEKGLDWSRVYRAAIGHLFKWWACAGPDEETGKSHLWHAGCCILFLIAYEIRSVGKDDRPKNTA